jgi:hypothetical protein
LVVEAVGLDSLLLSEAAGFDSDFDSPDFDSPPWDSPLFDSPPFESDAPFEAVSPFFFSPPPLG